MNKRPNWIRRKWERYKCKRWMKKNPDKGYRDYLLSMGPFKDVELDDE